MCKFLTSTMATKTRFDGLHVFIAEHDSGKKYHVYTRWGRVGVQGQDKLFGPYSNSAEAIAEFEGKFFDKTKNQWTNRHNFVAYPKKYTWLEIDYEEKDDDKKPEVWTHSADT